MMTQISIGLILQARSLGAMVVGNGASATLTEFARSEMIFDSGFQRGLSAAAVPLSGLTDAPDGAVLEARAVSIGDGGAETTAWVPVSTAAGYAWFGTISVPRSTKWFRAEVRVQASTAPAAQMVNTFAAGHVWSIWEQSNWGRLVSDIPGAAASLYDAITHPGDVQIVWRSAPTTVYPVIEANKNTQPVTPAMVTFANAWSALRPGEKLMLAFAVKTGTSFAQAMTRDAEDAAWGTGSTQRDWDVDKQINLTATANGLTQVGVAFVPGWEEAHVGFGALVPDRMLQSFTGHDATGAKIDIHSLWSTGVPRIPPRILADGTSTDLVGHVLNDPADGGIYDMRYTKACYFGPHGNNKTLPPASTYTVIGDMPLYSDVGENVTYANWVKQAGIVWDAGLHSDILTYPGQTAGAYRSETETLHFEAGDRDGRQRYAAISLFMMTKALGLHSLAAPQFNGRHDDPAGGFADFYIVGRNVTTERKRRELAGTLGALPASPAPLAPHHTEVMGWMINKQAATQAVLMTASGHPVIPDGQTYVRVSPNAGAFTYADEIIYGYGTLPGYLVAEDYARRTYLDWAVADIGQPAALLPALPVQHQQLDGLPSTLAGPKLYKVNGAQFTGGNTAIGTGNSQAYIVFKGRIDGRNQRDGLFCIGNSKKPNIKLEVNDMIVLKDGSISISVPASYGNFVELHFLFDRVNGIMRITDGTTTLAENLATGLTGNFADLGAMNIFGNGTDSPINATVETLEIYFGQTNDSGVPTYAVTAQAAAPYYATTGALTLSGTAPTDGTP